MKKKCYTVIVGNIGMVYDGAQLKGALESFAEYKRQSKENYGRAAGEDVALCEDGEPKKEYFAP